MSRGETFAEFRLRTAKLWGPRVASLAGLVVASLAVVALVRHLNPDRKLLLFDLGVGLIFASLLYVLARRMIRDEAEHRRRLSAAVVMGVTTTAAALGVFAVTLAGKPVGLQRLVQLLIIQTLGALAGAAVGLFVSFFAAAAVMAGRRLVARPTPAVDGLFIGLVTGLVGGSAVSYLPHLGAGFVASSAVACGICGYRSAELFDRLAKSR